MLLSLLLELGMLSPSVIFLPLGFRLPSLWKLPNAVGAGSAAALARYCSPEEWPVDERAWPVAYSPLPVGF